MGQKGSVPSPETQDFDIDFFLKAARDGAKEKVEWCLKNKNSDVNATSRRGSTALHIAAIHGRADVVEVLLENGAHINIKSKHGYTPLYLAVMENHPDICKTLLRNGADKVLAPANNVTAQTIAQIQGLEEIAQILEDEKLEIP